MIQKQEAESECIDAAFLIRHFTSYFTSRRARRRRALSPYHFTMPRDKKEAGHDSALARYYARLISFRAIPPRMP